jgi:hypothetical protein
MIPVAVISGVAMIRDAPLAILFGLLFGSLAGSIGWAIIFCRIRHQCEAWPPRSTGVTVADIRETF